jgi:hypothetical protein
MSSEVIEDLVEVFKIIDNNYDRDKAYTEGVFGATTTTGSKPAGSSLGQVGGGVAKATAKQTGSGLNNDNSTSIRQAAGSSTQNVAKGAKTTDKAREESKSGANE